MSQRADAVATAIAAAESAAVTIRQRAVDGPRRVEHKGAVDLVTEVDLAAEEAVRAVLAERSPGVPVLAEEGGGAATASTRWIVDPLDGTTNFVHGLPAYAVSVALQVDGELVAGCIVDVPRRETFAAGQGLGATLDGAPMRVSRAATVSDALLATGFPYDRRERAAWYLRFVEVFLVRSQGIRRAGAAALDLAHVAAGRLDGFWEFGLQAWDVAAGSLLVSEAGGRISDMALGPLDLDHPRVLASNGLIHDEMALTLQELLSSGGGPSSGP